jgi:glucose-1-phosphate cytidylyltransferase
MTGGRIGKIKKFLEDSDEDFCLTYGDGISDVNISKLIKFHNKQKLLATVLAVRPPARFGSLTIKNKKVTSFEEKNKNSESLINGGFFVLSKKIFKFIKKSSTIFEQYPLKKIASLGQLGSYYHAGFWMPMDTLRDKKIIEKYIRENKKKLKIWI